MAAKRAFPKEKSGITFFGQTRKSPWRKCSRAGLYARCFPRTISHGAVVDAESRHARSMPPDAAGR